MTSLNRKHGALILSSNCFSMFMIAPVLQALGVIHSWPTGAMVIRIKRNKIDLFPILIYCLILFWSETILSIALILLRFMSQNMVNLVNVSCVLEESMYPAVVG